METKSIILTALILLIGFSVNAQQDRLIAEHNVSSLSVQDKVHEAPQLSMEQLRNMQMNDLSLVVLDIRCREAFDAGTIKEARFIGDDLNIEKIWMLQRDASLVIYGNNISKTKEVSKMLLDKGFHNVFYLQSPLTELSKQGIDIRGNASKSDKRAKSAN